MLVFLSWSGARSKKVAEVFKSWLIQVIQAVEPWISSDIDKGARWSPAIADQLEKSKIGIICLTKENLTAPWILFEAGALSKTKDAYVCTFLLDIQAADVQQPLGQFQHTTLAKEDIQRLVRTINLALLDSGERPLKDGILEKAFETYWPTLSEQLSDLSKQRVADEPPQRADREVLQEILDLSRIQDRRLARLEQIQAFPRSDNSALTPALIDVSTALGSMASGPGPTEPESYVNLATLMRQTLRPSKDIKKNIKNEGKKGESS